MAKSVEEFDGFEELKDYGLDDDREKEMIEKQNECVFMWTNKKGEPVGVIMSYLAAKGKFWLAVTEQRARVIAVRRDPRTCIAITSTGTDMNIGKTVTYKGNTKIHRNDAPEIKGWFFEAYARRLHHGNNETRIKEVATFLNIPERVVLEFTPTQEIGFDGDKMAAITPGATGGFDRIFD